MKRLLLLSALCISMINASGQITTKNVAKKRVNPGYINGWGLDKRYSFDIFDTSFSNFQQYHPLRRKLTFFQDLGDVGTPYKNLQFEVYSKPGFDLGLNPYNAYNFTHANSLYYNAPVPFTYFYYTQGRSGDERSMINFEAQHTQNINKNLNIAINYRSITNNSFYLRQKSSMKNLQATSLYTSKNKRYQAAANLAWNKVITQESGGNLKDSISDSLFRNFPRIIRPVPVSLNNANNIVRYREHSLKQYYWFGVNKTDSFNKNYYPKFGLTHTFIMQKQATYYTDQDKDRYFYDTLSNYQNYKTNDSLGMQLFSNRVGLIKQNQNYKGLYFNGGITYDNFKVYQSANLINYRKFNNYNLSADANFVLDIKNKYLGGDANYFISGYNAGDYLLRGYLGLSSFTSKYNFNTLISGNSQLKTPTRLESATLSNHYTWQNDFNKTFTNNIGLAFKLNLNDSIKSKGHYINRNIFYVKAEFNTISNYNYYGTDGKPHQYTGTLIIPTIKIVKNFNLNKFRFNNSILYQRIDKTAAKYIRIPEFAVSSQFFFQDKIFKKVMLIQAGIDVNYTTQYYGSTYNPATHQFELQDKVKIGNYPYCDFFINGEVKTLRFFVKLEHFNQDIGGRNVFPNYFYSSPYYPSAPRRLRIGISWRFYY